MKAGFVLILTHPETGNPASPQNPNYRGLQRKPCWPWDPEGNLWPWIDRAEEAALERYIFGDVAEDDGLIASLDDAQRLLEEFAGSNREYEIVFVRTGAHTGCSNLKDATMQLLGFDVASPEPPFYSIVDDFSPDPRMQSHKAKLNAHGLFDDQVAAEAYLSDYRGFELPEHQDTYAVWEVRLPLQDRNEQAI